MGNNRKNKSAAGNSHHHRRSSSKVPMTTSLQSTESNSSTVAASHPEDPSYDFSEFTAEANGSNSHAFRITWREIVALGLFVAAFASLSILVGVATGISLSIQYYDSTAQGESSVANQRILNDLGVEGSVYRRTTTFDQSIASSNRVRPQNSQHGDSLGRVIHTTEAGQKSVLMVVEESSMINGAANNISDDDDDSEHCSEWTDELGRGFSSRPVAPRFEFNKEWGAPPEKLCSDGKTRGFDSWSSLRNSIHAFNHYSAVRYERWQDYFQAMSRLQAQAASSNGQGGVVSPITFDDDSMYYEEEKVFIICPGSVLRTKTEPIFINSEGVTIECDSCTIEGRGTHFMFGPEAKNAIVRGLKFTKATTSSVVFYYDGADASFENCSWINNQAEHQNFGAVADVKATRAYVVFFRCHVSKPIGLLHAVASSLSIRQPN